MRKNKIGVSTIVATVIMIGIAVAIGALIWAIVSNLIGESLEEGEACFGVFDQVKLNNDYTCYNSTSNRLQFSISVGDLDLNGVLVSVSFAGTSQSATITDISQNLSNVKNYPGGSDGVKVPSKNTGRTYFFNGITSQPLSVGIIPIVKGEQCGVSDTLYEIDDCRALIS